MQRFQFHVDGLTTHDLRRWRRLSESTAVASKRAASAKISLAGKAAIWTTVAVGVVYAIARPGSLRIDSPVDGSTVHERTVAIWGTVRNARVREVALSINDVPQLVSAQNGVFRADVQLGEGRNTLRAKVQRTAARAAAESDVVHIYHLPLNRHGNPIGEWAGLLRDQEFEGRVLLAWTNLGQVIDEVFPDNHPLWTHLRQKGFKIRLKTGPFNPAWLRECDQLWIFSSASSGNMDTASYGAVKEFLRRGKGLYLLADNAPALVEATRLASDLFGTSIDKDWKGGKEIKRGREPTDANKSWMAANHPLLTDVNVIFEGITVSHIKPCDKIEPILRASDGQILAAVAKVRSLRVVVDCGFTRYYHRFFKDKAGTLRFAENVAAYLMGKEHKQR